MQPTFDSSIGHRTLEKPDRRKLVEHSSQNLKLS